MIKLIKQIKLFTPEIKPTPSSDYITLSVDVCVIDENGLTQLAYYNFNEDKWMFHTNTLVDYSEKGNQTKWMWYYPPVNIYDIEF